MWDVTRCKQVKELVGHTNRVSALAWNNAILSSGGRDSAVRNWDVRKRKHEACVSTLNNHEQEVCGLRWSHNGMQLASGGNDNMLCIYSAGFELQHRINAHQAAVKALAWCPFQSNLLASGGGTADRCIKFWNTTTGAMLNSIDTGSQVCALQWSRHEREILSSHGYSKNQLILWRYPSLVKVRGGAQGNQCEQYLGGAHLNAVQLFSLSSLTHAGWLRCFSCCPNTAFRAVCTGRGADWPHGACAAHGPVP